MQLLFKIFSRNLVLNCRQTMRASQIANLKTFNVKDKHENLFNQMIKKPGLTFLQAEFVKHGYEIRIAGGAVRDLICEKIPDDIDLATTAVPDKMIEILEKHGNVRLITTKSGKKHGTIIARVDDQAQYEITTLRIDKKTDGRFAEVEFIEDWKLDASRRDLTFNSLFLDFNGIIYDYFNGIEHLKTKKVLFVGDPVERMVEDYLRILRYFRFYIRYGNLFDHDPTVIKAIEQCKEGLTGISGPRIWTELKKILSYEQSICILDLMFNQLKLGSYMGFNSNSKSIDKVKEIEVNLKKFNDFIDKNQTNKELNLSETDKNLNYLSIICALLDDETELKNLRERLSLSNQELYASAAILHYRDRSDFDVATAIKEIVLTPKTEKERKHIWLLEVFKYKGDLKSYVELKNKQLPEFDQKFLSNKIKDRFENKANVGKFLEKLKMIWIESDFKLTGDELLEKFEELYADGYGSAKKQKK